MTITPLADAMRKAATLHSTLADAIGNPGRVYCLACGHSEPVNAAHCLRHGWPKCCGLTMTIDKPAAEPEHGGEDG